LRNNTSIRDTVQENFKFWLPQNRPSSQVWPEIKDLSQFILFYFTIFPLSIFIIFLLIIFIQEPPRFLIRRTPSHTNPMGDLLYGTPNHLEWTLFIYQDPSQNNYTRVTTYVNKHLARMRFTLQLDIINYHDINVLVFHNDRDINLMINIYSDNNQTVL